MNRFELIDYEKIYEPQLLSFLEKCLPESGRALDIDGRHSFYKAISSHFVGFWYMLANEDIIGTVAVREMNGNDCELKSLYLLEKYQGQGYGRQLLEKAVNFAKTADMRKCILTRCPQAPVQSSCTESSASRIRKSTTKADFLMYSWCLNFEKGDILCGTARKRR